MKRISGPTREKVTWYWRMLHNCYSLQNSRRMRGECSTQARHKKCIHNFYWTTWSEEILCVGKMMILKWTLKKLGWKNMEWTDLAHDTDQWRGLVNTVVYNRVSWEVRTFLTNWATSSFSRWVSGAWSYLSSLVLSNNRTLDANRWYMAELSRVGKITSSTLFILAQKSAHRRKNWYKSLSLLHIQKAMSSNLFPDTGYPDWGFSYALPRICCDSTLK
jgi:hypothetical protein